MHSDLFLATVQAKWCTHPFCHSKNHRKLGESARSGDVKEEMNWRCGGSFSELRWRKVEQREGLCASSPALLCPAA